MLCRILRLTVLLSIILPTACKNPQQENLTILENGRYFNGEDFIPFAEIIIKNRQIHAVKSKKSAAKGNRISAKGKYIIPGLIDAHVHLDGCPVYPYADSDSLQNAGSCLQCGVTTVIDLFFNEADVMRFKDSINAYPMRYASVILSGPMLTAEKAHGTEYGIGTRIIGSAKEAVIITNEVISNGADVVKLAYQPYSSGYSINKEMLQNIVRTTHERGKKVFAHINRAAEAMDCADAGTDVLAHLPQDTFTDAQLEKLKHYGIVMIPTVSVVQALYQGFDTSYFSDTLLIRTIAPGYKGSLKNPFQPPFKDSNIVAIYTTNLQKCIRRKMPLAAGTDAGNYAVFYGYSLHHE